MKKVEIMRFSGKVPEYVLNSKLKILQISPPWDLRNSRWPPPAILKIKKDSNCPLDICNTLNYIDFVV